MNETWYLELQCIPVFPTNSLKKSPSYILFQPYLRIWNLIPWATVYPCISDQFIKEKLLYILFPTILMDLISHYRFFLILNVFCHTFRTMLNDLMWFCSWLIYTYVFLSHIYNRQTVHIIPFEYKSLFWNFIWIKRYWVEFFF